MPSDAKRKELDIEKLSRKYGKYRLVVAVSKRARELHDQSYRLLQRHTASLISQALEEMEEGKLKLLKEPED